MNLITRKIIAREFLLLIVITFIVILSFAGTYFKNLYLEKKANNLENDIKVINKHTDTLRQTLNLPDIISHTRQGVPIIRFEQDFYFINKADETNLQRYLKQLQKSNKSENEIQSYFINFTNKYTLKLDTLFNSKDGQQVTKSQLLNSGYSQSRISKGLKNGIITVLGGLPERHITIMLPDGTYATINETQTLEAVAKGAKYIDGPDKIVKIPINLNKYLKNVEKFDSLDKTVNELILESQKSKSKILSFKNRIYFSLNVLWISLIFIFLIRYLFYGILWSFKTLKFKE